MIVACPSCAVRYEIADNHFANGPRQVRCTRCRHEWQASPPPERPRQTVAPIKPEPFNRPVSAPPRPPLQQNPDFDLSTNREFDPAAAASAGAIERLMERPSAPQAIGASREPPAAPIEQAMPSSMPAPLAVSVSRQVPELTPVEMPRLEELRREERPFNFVEPPILPDELDIRPPKSRLPVTIVICLAVIITALVCLAVARQRIALQWPPAEQIYNKFGLHINHNGEGLDFVQVRSELKYEGGATMLVVEGQIHNGSPVEQQVPNVDAEAIGADGKTLQSWRIDAPAARVPAGGLIPFHSSIRAPQDNVTEINLDFIEIKNDAD